MATALDRPGPGLMMASAGGDFLEVPLSRGRVLAVRGITPADADRLERLFDGLSDDDRYLRFFGYSRPGRRFIEHMTRADGQDSCHLVALISGPLSAGVGGDLVAEAGYELLPDGNGEFALTVAAGWRGWLGPYLLDTLVAVATARGIPNLVADIRAENTRMLSLVKARGYVIIARDGADMRVAIDAAQPARSSVGTAAVRRGSQSAAPMPR